MSDTRPHLSIGEVLSLLQDEFPDITISKIRFLESQGLLNPERTPSGYRKFYDHDVEQLRWVLRQQKDNFLPLKVIKDRLAAGQLDGSASESGVLDLAPPSSAATRSPTTPAVTAAPVAAPAAVAPRPEDAPDRPRSPGADAAPAVSGAPPAGPAGQDAAPTRAAAIPADGEVPGDHGGRPAGRPGGPPGGRNDADDRAERGASHAGATGSPRPRPEAAVGSSASLTAEELCAATGVTPRLLAELERFGLVDGRALGPDTVYDDEAMVVCRLAVTLSDAGIEARHLRMFKVSAEREAGLYEQLALPRLRAQRPEARQEAVAQVAALSGTAAELHAALLRRALRGTLGPL